EIEGARDMAALVDAGIDADLEDADIRIVEILLQPVGSDQGSFLGYGTGDAEEQGASHAGNPECESVDHHETPILIRWRLACRRTAAAPKHCGPKCADFGEFFGVRYGERGKNIHAVLCGSGNPPCLQKRAAAVAVALLPPAPPAQAALLVRCLLNSSLTSSFLRLSAAISMSSWVRCVISVSIWRSSSR